MKYFLCLSLILLCFSRFQCQETEDNEDFETEDVDPVDTNEGEEESSVPDLDLIPSFKSTPKRKGKANTDSEPESETPLTSLVSTFEKGTVGIFGTIRDRLASRVQQVGSHFQETQQRINKRVQDRLTGFMENIQHQFDG